MQSQWVYVVIDPSRVHMFRYYLEACDNLGIMTVVDRWRAVLKVRFSADQQKEIQQFLSNTQPELRFQIIERPTPAINS